jgi:hypothetical protein
VTPRPVAADVRVPCAAAGRSPGRGRGFRSPTGRIRVGQRVVIATNWSWKAALEILDAVVDALGREGLMVILDNHVSRADWCYAGADGNEFWYSSQYPEASVIDHPTRR